MCDFFNRKIDNLPLVANQRRYLRGRIRCGRIFSDGKLTMIHRSADVTYSDSTKAAQESYDSRARNARLQTIAVTGARIIRTTANEMKRFDMQYDLVSICVAEVVADRTLRGDRKE